MTLPEIPSGATVAPDTVTFIYFLEHHERHFTAAEALFRRIEAGDLRGTASTLVLTELLVYCTALNGTFRAPQRRQGKARRAANGESLASVATRPWRRWGAPFGRAAERPSAALRALEAGRLPRRARALRLTAQRLAESTVKRGAVH